MNFSPSWGKRTPDVLQTVPDKIIDEYPEEEEQQKHLLKRVKSDTIYLPFFHDYGARGSPENASNRYQQFMELSRFKKQFLPTMGNNNDFANNEEHLREEYQELNDGDNQTIFNVDSSVPITNESVNPEVIGTPMEL